MPGAAQDGEELLEELDRDVAAAGELADRDRAGAAAAGELGERADRVRRLRRDREHVLDADTPDVEGRMIGVGRRGCPALRYSQPRSVACRTAWARSTAPSLP